MDTHTKIPINSKDNSVQHFDFGIPMMCTQQAVSNSSQSRPPVVMPKLQKKSLKQDVTPAPQTQVYIKPEEERSVHHFDFGIPVKYIQQAVSNSSQPRPSVVMPKLKMPPQVNQVKAAAGPRPRPVSAKEPQPSTPSVAGTSDSGRGKIMGKKGAESARLEAQKAVLLQEKEKLKAVLETVNVQIEMGKALLYKQKINTAGSLKIEQLEAAANDEKQQNIQTERLLAEQLAETKRLKEELAKAQKKLEEEKLQREEDVSRLQAEHIKITSMMKAAATKAQEDLENERSQWLQERSTIQSALKSLKESIDETMEEKDKFITDVMNQVHQLEQTQEEAQKKLKKRSLRKRFMQLFKRS
ncbi:MAP7 domain-containing protein 2-like [Archocentrus centrarchus]|uniref:MAP7 domain-containing protein 2-like n=1 Tax=Archocentrus centrarchus TaxID=63155 RepID=UPI0011EA3735|nr:MAP7 domain-containing protein 2-like [Archocentrus centrarchus]